jgi:hypothetical protein
MRAPRNGSEAHETIGENDREALTRRFAPALRERAL